MTALAWRGCGWQPDQVARNSADSEVPKAARGRTIPDPAGAGER
jgi:hypothetical protein